MNAPRSLQALAIVAVLLALLAVVAGSPTRAAPGNRPPASLDAAALAIEIEHEEDHVTARELAEWIRSDKPGLRVLDVRSESEFAKYHIPSAERTSLSDVAARTPAPDETLVLYSEGGAHAAQAWVLLRTREHEHVYFLRGGLLDWIDDVMNPTVSGDSAAYNAALSRYFGGVPRAASAQAGKTPTLRAMPVSSVEHVRRRGC